MTDTDTQTDRINQLYWESELTVDAISEKLTIGKSALYSAIRPIPSGMTCAECGDTTVFTNRTNRAANTAFCPSCEDAVELGATAAWSHPSDRDRLPRRDERADGSGRMRWGVTPQRMALIGGGAAIGVLLGAGAVMAVRRR